MKSIPRRLAEHRDTDAVGRGEAPDIAIGDLLSRSGFRDPASQLQARSVLESTGLTNASKLRISGAKLSRVRQVLDDAFGLSCLSADCRAAVVAQKPTAAVIQVASADCSQCGGSTNLRSATKFLRRCAEGRMRRLVFVGGSPGIRQELRALVGAHVELRLVDGTGRRTKDQAGADLEWADLVLVAGASQLKHRISNQYTEAEGANRRKVLQVNKRGIAALLDYASEHIALHTHVALDRSL